MRSCQDISTLVSESMERRLPLGRRVAIRMHLLMCSYCSRFERQLKFLRKAARSATTNSIAGTNVPTRALPRSPGRASSVWSRPNPTVSC